MNRTQYVIDHIKASYPCSMRGVVNWCIEQGLEEACGPAITSLLMESEIEIYVDDGVLIVSPV